MSSTLRYIRPEFLARVALLARRMDHEVKANTEKKGDWNAWKPDLPLAWTEFVHHTRKLEAALNLYVPQSISEHVADCANFLMKIDELFGMPSGIMPDGAPSDILEAVNPGLPASAHETLDLIACELESLVMALRDHQHPADAAARLSLVNHAKQLSRLGEDEQALREESLQADDALFLLFESMAAAFGNMLLHFDGYLTPADRHSRKDLLTQVEEALKTLRAGREYSRRVGFALRYLRSGKAEGLKQQVVTCVYCGHEYTTGTPTSQAEELTAHIKVCEKHPLRAAEQRIKELEVGLRDLHHHTAGAATSGPWRNEPLHVAREKALALLPPAQA